MTTLYLILQLAWTFFVIGAFTIGGGYAMLSLIQNQVVVEHGWISESAFTDIVAVSQMTPGPIGINSATYVGYDVLYGATGSQFLGVCGSLTATLALMIPSFIIMLLIVRFYLKFRTSRLYAGTMDWLKPCVVGLIGAAALILIFRTSWSGITPSVRVLQDNFPDWKSWCLLGGAFVAGYWGKVNPIYVILAGAALGLLLY
ncbi:MAG: chromate transporter [Bacteroidales bacterium]|nr:chromate transporter [Bacteroidales bacterium]